MAIQFRNNKVLFRDGSIAMDPACCCAPNTCCVTPPDEMLLTPSNHWTDVTVPGGFASLGGVDGDCEEIRDLTPWTLGKEIVGEYERPITPCDDVNDWELTLPGAATGYWFLLIEEWSEFYCNHFPGVPPAIPPADFGCCDLEGVSVHLLFQLALRTITNVETGEPECWYFCQVAWFTDDGNVCRYYAFKGTEDLLLASGLGSDCTVFESHYEMTFDPDHSESTIPDTASNPCHGCNLTYDPPTQVPVVLCHPV